MHLHLSGRLARVSATSSRQHQRKSNGHPQHRRIVGSIRKESFTLKIANALAKLAPASLKLEVMTLHGISFFNQDLEAAPPADWLAFREKLQKSSGVLFVTPEYNRSIPGVLKNAIDVGSRPYGKSSFLGKPTGIISNSPGPLGGVNAAKHLQKSCRVSPGRSWGSRKPI